MCDDTPRWLSPAQIAEALGVGESSVKRWIDAGKMGAERSPGGHRRVALVHFDRFVQENNRQIVNPDVIGLTETLDLEDTAAMLELVDRAISEGDSAQVRQFLATGQRQGRSMAHLLDTVVYPAYKQLRKRCEHPSLECPVLHRAIETVRSAVLEAGFGATQASRGRRVTLLDCGYEVDGLPTFLAEIAVRDLVSATQLGLSVPETVVAGLQNLKIWQHLWISAHGRVDKKKQQTLREIISTLATGQTRTVHLFTDVVGLQGIPNVSYVENFSEFRALLKAR